LVDGGSRRSLQQRQRRREPDFAGVRTLRRGLSQRDARAQEQPRQPAADRPVLPIFLWAFGLNGSIHYRPHFDSLAAFHEKGQDRSTHWFSSSTPLIAAIFPSIMRPLPPRGNPHVQVGRTKAGNKFTIVTVVDSELVSPEIRLIKR
jgi:hypothetical protein